MDPEPLIAEFPDVPPHIIHAFITYHGFPKSSDADNEYSYVYGAGLRFRIIPTSCRPAFYKALARALGFDPTHRWAWEARKSLFSRLPEYTDQFRDYLFPFNPVVPELILARERIETLRILAGGRLDTLNCARVRLAGDRKKQYLVAVDTFYALESILKQIPASPGGIVQRPSFGFSRDPRHWWTEWYTP